MRLSAKELTSLILDEERLRTERSDRKNWKTRVTGIEEFGPQGSGFGADDRTPPRRKPERRRQGTDEEDAEYRLAIEASKHEAEEAKKRGSAAPAPVQDDDLAKAIKLSKEEEDLRRRELEESNAASLFDDTPAPSTQQQPQYTGLNQGYQQQPAVDWFGNPVEQQQPQNTGYLNNAYSQPQPTGFQPQQTGFQNGFQQPQQTGFDQFQQQQPNYLQQQNTVQPQQNAFDNLNNPYGQQQSGFGNQFGQPQPQQQQVSSPAAGTHNPWSTNQSHEALKPMQTGSNNPFAVNRPQPVQQQTGPPSLNSIAEQKTAQPFNNQSTYNPIANFQAPQQQPQQQPPSQKTQNPQHERLNALLASGEGMDTFGNTGDLRIPAQHTAPGTFVSNSGQGLNRLHANQTGNNPFFNQQFTGGPQQHSQGGFGAQQQFPAQTGRAGMFGQPNNNPFGGQQRQGQGQGGSLIDL